jgi:hypothetical protein
MLRESAIAFDHHLDPVTIADPAVPTTIPGGNALLRFVDAVLGQPLQLLDDARSNVVQELGPEGLVDAAFVIGNFQMMNRVADGTGIHVASEKIEEEAELIATLGLLDLRKE